MTHLPHHKRQLLLQFLPMPQVIRVKKSDPLTLCPTQSIVSRYCSSRVLWIAFILDALVRLHIRSNNLQCVIFRTVILNQKFPVLIGLRLNTFDCFRYETSTRPSGSDDRYQSVVLHNLFFN